MKEITIFDHDKCVGVVEVELEDDDLVSVFTALDADENPIYVLCVPDMGYGIVISKEIYCRMNESLDAEIYD